MKRVVLAFLSALSVVGAEPQQASAPQAVTISVYDQGFALFQELRRVSLARGSTEVVLSGLPRSLDAATTAFSVTAGSRQVDLLEQAFSTNASEAELRWTLNNADAEGPSTLRVTYRADGMGWRASHELSLNEDASSARFASRVALHNRTGRAVDSARVKLVLTERGTVPKLPVEGGSPGGLPGQRFTYGATEATPDRLVAGLATAQTFEMPDPVSLPDGVTKFVALSSAEKMPAQKIFVYDGVRFDRFQRSRTTDWNYGTESHGVVDSFVEMEIEPASGLALPMLPGKIRLTQKRDDGALDFLGEADLPPGATNSTLRVRIGPARGVGGERERTGYTEIRAAHEYEESFEIRLKNEGDTPVEVRVVEHLYRSADYDIVKADTEYKRTSPQVIEFAPQIKAGGQRVIRYTVHYRW